MQNSFKCYKETIQKLLNLQIKTHYVYIQTCTAEKSRLASHLGELVKCLVQKGVLISGESIFGTQQSVLILGMSGCPYFRDVLISGMSLFQGFLISGVSLFLGCPLRGFPLYVLSFIVFLVWQVGVCRQTSLASGSPGARAVVTGDTPTT